MSSEVVSVDPKVVCNFTEYVKNKLKEYKSQTLKKHSHTCLYCGGIAHEGEYCKNCGAPFPPLK